jgi:hypothetical protein
MEKAMIYRIVFPTALVLFAGLVLAVTRPTTRGVESVAAAAHGPEAGGLCLAANVGRDHFGGGDPVELTLTLENVSKEPVRIALASLLDTFEFDVTLPTGEPAPLTLYGKQVATGRSLGFRTFPLKPGEKAAHAIALSRLFDMTLHGEYKVTARRRIHSELVVSSNPITITVREDPKAATKPAQ